MHALWKTLFFTSGAVGLLLLVFIWSSLHYGLFSLSHFISSVLNIKFAGYTLPDYLTIPSSMGIGEKVHQLKIIFSILLGAGSLILIFTSYLPRISWQFRFISSVITVILFSALVLFWQCIMNGNEIIDYRERTSIFLFTAITYLAGIFTLWYAFHIKPKSRASSSREKIPNYLPAPDSGKDTVPNSAVQAKQPEEKEESEDLVESEPMDVEETETEEKLIDGKDVEKESSTEEPPDQPVEEDVQPEEKEESEDLVESEPMDVEEAETEEKLIDEKGVEKESSTEEPPDQPVEEDVQPEEKEESEDLVESELMDVEESETDEKSPDEQAEENSFSEAKKPS